MNGASIKVSQALQDIAHGLDDALECVAGERVAFTLLVFTEGRASYITTANREESVQQIKHLLDLWEKGMPDIPAHTVAG